MRVLHGSLITSRYLPQSNRNILTLATHSIVRLHARPLLSAYTRFSVFYSSTKSYINASRFQVFHTILLLIRAMLHFEKSMGFIFYKSFIRNSDVIIRFYSSILFSRVFSGERRLLVEREQEIRYPGCFQARLCLFLLRKLRFCCFHYSWLAGFWVIQIIMSVRTGYEETEKPLELY